MGGMGDILAGLNISTAVLAIIGAGFLVGTVGFGLWAVDVLATFFDDPDDPDRESDDSDRSHYEADLAAGVAVDCPSCGYPMTSDAAMHAIHNGYCPKCGEDM